MSVRPAQPSRGRARADEACEGGPSGGQRGRRSLQTRQRALSISRVACTLSKRATTLRQPRCSHVQPPQRLPRREVQFRCLFPPRALFVGESDCSRQLRFRLLPRRDGPAVLQQELQRRVVLHAAAGCEYKARRRSEERTLRQHLAFIHDVIGVKWHEARVRPQGCSHQKRREAS